MSTVNTTKNSTARTERNTLPSGTRLQRIAAVKNTAVTAKPVNLRIKNILTIYTTDANSLTRGSKRCTGLSTG